MLGRGGAHAAGAFVTAGERHAGNVGMLNERLAQVFSEPGDDVEYAGREAGLRKQSGKHPQRHRRMFGRLGDDDVASGKRLLREHALVQEFDEHSQLWRRMAARRPPHVECSGAFHMPGQHGLHTALRHPLAD